MKTWKLLLASAFASLGLLSQPTQAAWSLLEDFNGFADGTDGGFTETFNGPATSIASTGAPHDKVLNFTGNNSGGQLGQSGISSPAFAAEGTTGTVFFQTDIANAGGDSLFAFGPSGVTQYGELNVLFRLPGDGVLEVRNGGSYVDTDQAISLNTQYNFWVVFDNAANTFDLWYSSGFDADASTQVTTGAGATSSFGFRSTTAGDISVFYPGLNGTSDYWLDNIWYDTAGQNLTNPAVAATPPVELWNVDADGVFSVGSNWLSGNAPSANDDALFGNIITQNRTVTLDDNISLNRITFGNTGDGDYFLVPESTEVLTFTGEAAVTSTGRHWLSLEVAGTSGLTKQGTGELVLDHANSFSGGLTIADGRLSVTHPNAIPSGQNIALTAAGSNLQFGGDNGFFVENGSTGGGYVGGTINGVISGEGSTIVTLGAEVTWTGANTYSGATTVEGTDTVLTLSGSGTLGASDGTSASQTRIGGTAQVVLDGMAVGSEVLYLDERADEGTPAHLSSSGSSSWAGNVKADIPGEGSRYKIEATSGTLELSGIISAWDEAAPNDRYYVFDAQGGSAINVSGSITDLATDADGEFIDEDMNNVPDGTDAGANVHVIKRGSGTMTISTGGLGTAADNVHFHRATTVVEEGTLAVVDSQTANAGELLSSTIEVRSGATFDTSAFDTYSLQIVEDPDGTPFNGDEIGQRLSGSGTVATGTGTIRAFEDSVIAPGDSVGTLTIDGNMSLTPSGPNANGGLHFELAQSSTTGSGVNDLLDVNGTLTLSASGGGEHTINVTPTQGAFGPGTYTVITADTRAGTSTIGNFAVNVVSNNGTVLNTRQSPTVAFSGDNVTLTFGAAEARTWNGSAGNNTWDVGTSTNWTGGDNRFRDLDSVTFGSGGTQKNVVVNAAVTPSSTTFNSASTYTFTGEGGIEGSGAVNVNAGTVKFQNSGNNYTGETTIASGAVLETDTASTGSMVVNGSLVVGSSGLSPLPEFTYIDAVHGANTALSGGGALVPAADIWEVRTGIGGNSDSIYEADANDPATAPEIQTTISGLSPNTTYTVYANFWDATGSSWQVQAGDTPGNLTLYANPGDNVADATAGVLTSTLIHTSELSTAAGNRTLYSAPLGEYMTDGSGNLVVYIDDKGTDEGDNRTFYDGLSYNSGVTNVFGGGETLSVNGDLSLNSDGSLDLDIGAVGLDSISVTGTALLEGTINVNLVGDAPEDGMQYTLLTADGGISTPLGSLDFGSGLPDNFSASYNEALTELILTFSAGLDGDFNGDGIVNLADYTVWRNNLGNPDESVLTNNGDDLNGVDTGDYDLWKNNFGATAGALNTLQGNQAAVPEPGAACLLVGLLGLGAIQLRRPIK
ncbi:beta strand repeat-containing protein [Aeoliella sp.]|uniref:beta strand repeat-containing protein n=1 Tax=Aeoliella sp. TaxID=2795800 RepID=UPI003CCBC9D7